MGCACTDKKKLDFDYVRKLANAESLTKKIDIQIYFTFGYDGKTKYYDYEESNGGRKLQVVEIIRFSEHQSLEVLPSIEFAGFDTIDSEVKTANSELDIITANSEINQTVVPLVKKKVKKVKYTK